MPTSGHSAPDDLDDSLDDRVELVLADGADPIEYQGTIRGEDPIGTDIAQLSETAFDEICLHQHYGVVVTRSAAGNLAEDQVIPP